MRSINITFRSSSACQRMRNGSHQNGRLKQSVERKRHFHVANKTDRTTRGPRGKSKTTRRTMG